jgi:spatzle-processing enzyme
MVSIIDSLRPCNTTYRVVFIAGVKSDIKLKVDIGVVTNPSCQRSFASQTIVATQLCAGGEAGKDSCGGDSGGPLMSTHLVGRKQISYLIGLVSYGARKCGSRGLPGVYTRVGEYMTWIESKITE